MIGVIIVSVGQNNDAEFNVKSSELKTVDSPFDPCVV
jgi:hypothetical protein